MTEASETDCLYHYTAQDGLLGILENNCLWATHYKFLNDYSEIVITRGELVKCLKERPRLENFDIKPAIKSLYEFVSDKAEIYITSFCKKSNRNSYIIENGLLSQWRGYGNNGGFAILFNRNELEKLIGEEGIKLNAFLAFIGDVEYSNNEYEHFFSNHIENIENWMFKNEDDYNKFEKAIFSCVTLYKDCGFEEEKEVRIVSCLGEKSNKPRQFRDKNGEQVPYIELFGFRDKKLFDLKNKNEPLPIKKIIVGPHKDKEARATWLRIKLASMGRRNIEVTVSKIPFVGR